MLSPADDTGRIMKPASLKVCPWSTIYLLPPPSCFLPFFRRFLFLPFFGRWPVLICINRKKTGQITQKAIDFFFG